jgi:hypothetical protein
MLRRLRALRANENGFTIIEVLGAVGGLAAATGLVVLVAHLV